MYRGYIEYELDEEYPFLLRRPQQGNPYGEVYGRLSIPVYGMATIAYNDVDDWIVDSLDIWADNARRQNKAESWKETVTGPVFEAVKDYLNTKQSDTIADMIRNDIEGQRQSEVADLAKARRREAAMGW